MESSCAKKLSKIIEEIYEGPLPNLFDYWANINLYLLLSRIMAVPCGGADCLGGSFQM